MRIIFALPAGPFVEVSHQRGAVVLLDEIDDRFGQMMLSGKLGAVFDMSDYYQRAHGRDERLQTIFFVFSLILDEVARLEHLADIVVIRAHANQQPSCPDGVGGRFGDRAHGDRMVIRARRPADQFLQQGVRHVAQFQKAHVRQHAEEPLDERQQAGHYEAGGQRPCAVLQRVFQQRPAKRLVRGHGRHDR